MSGCFYLCPAGLRYITLLICTEKAIISGNQKWFLTYVLSKNHKNCFYFYAFLTAHSFIFWPKGDGGAFWSPPLLQSLCVVVTFNSDIYTGIWH
jgi:hypothetical protein